MKNKKIIPAFIMLLIMLFTINVKASSYWDADLTLEKGENSGKVYNEMPTEVKKGDVISVKVIINDAEGWKIGYLHSELEWDNEAFEIVETNGKYYTPLKDNFSCNVEIEDNGLLYYICLSEIVAEDDKEEIIEFNFRVKKNAPEGIYKIYQKNDGRAFEIYVDDDWTNMNGGGSLEYQIGKTKLSSDYTKDKIGNSTYIIGNHMFTRDGSDEYNGVLTTDYIMLASKSIESNDRKDMIVYAKNARGNWINAITNESITPPDEFEITYENMKVSYQENGFYSDSNDENRLKLVQLSKDKAVITIENNRETINGMATVNGNVATLNVNGKSYKVTILENEVKIETSDQYIGNKTLQKVANYSMSNLFESFVHVPYGESYPKMYLNSDHSGKYTNGDYELYLVRVREDAARICIKANGEDNCIIDTAINGNEDGWYLNGEETTYAFHTEEATNDLNTEERDYGINWLTDKIEISCYGVCTGNPYVGMYQKEKSLSMEDAIEVWEKNGVKYNVIFNYNNIENAYEIEVNSGENLPREVSYGPPKSGYVFVGWMKENGDILDPDTPITDSLILTASYKKIPGKPTLVFADETNLGHDYYQYENGKFYYNISIELDDEYDGFNVYGSNGLNYELVDSSNDGSPVSVVVDEDDTKLFYVKPYIMVNGEKFEGTSSEIVTIHPEVFTVSFDSKGGNSVTSQEVPYESLATKPEDPERQGFIFNGWTLNDEAFNFNNNKIESNITLTANWTVATPVLAEVSEEERTDYYTHRLYLSNDNDYCLDDSCTRLATDHYAIDGYEVFEVINEVVQENPIRINSASEIAPYQYADLAISPNEIKHYVIRAFANDNVSNDTIYSDYSNEIIIDTTIAAPVIAFNPNYDTFDPTYEVENWIEITNINDYKYLCGENNCYKIEGFELYNKVDNEYESVSSFGPTDYAHVTADYGDDLHYYIRAYVYINGDPIYSEYSNELVLDTAAPACYTDNSNANHWTNHPESDWTKVDSIISEGTCLNPDAYACYFDTTTSEYHWSNNPDEGWSLFPGITTEGTCRS